MFFFFYPISIELVQTSAVSSEGISSHQIVNWESDDTECVIRKDQYAEDEARIVSLCYLLFYVE